MLDVDKLKPKSVTLGSELKFFSLDSGVSSGSNVSVEFDIPTMMSSKEIRHQMLLEKARLDLWCLSSEAKKGIINQEQFDEKKALLVLFVEEMKERIKLDRDSND